MEGRPLEDYSREERSGAAMQWTNDFVDATFVFRSVHTMFCYFEDFVFGHVRYYFNTNFYHHSNVVGTG
jgi:hypothetical protein